jgi:hypothetical protein
MTWVFAIFLVVHGLIHLLGTAKAFRLAELPQLTQPVSWVGGVVWLIAALLFLTAAGCLFLWPRWWWAVGAAALATSMLAIIPSWSDAKAGAVANAMALVGVIFGFLSNGPLSLRAAYEHDVDRALVRTTSASTINDADLMHLPEPVQRYLRISGVMGHPRVRNLRARMHGRLRSGADARWMPCTAEQYNFFDQPARLFYMTASSFLIPSQGYHRYVGSSASMSIKVAGLVPVVEFSGSVMTQGETVTMFNDMCVMAPATLIDPGIQWEPIDACRARATFTNAGHTIRAELTFNDVGELTNFRSDDRYQTLPDGKSAGKVRWSTPLREYRSFGSIRLTSGGEARFHEPGGEYAYIELTLDDVQYNVSPR